MIKVCSLFSGIGGIDLGFQQAGFDIVWANEFDKDAAATYRYNFGTDHMVEKDIRKVNVSEIPDFDVLVAGFPCESFSTAGKQLGFDDPRGNLFFQVARVVEAKKPRVVFLENVANLLEHDDGKSFLTVYNALVPYGYSFKYCIMDSCKYGNVPQHRERIFIVAFINSEDCDRFIFPGEIPLTVKINDIIDRSTKHSDCYYYTEKNQYFSELKKIVKSTKDVYRIYDYGLSNKSYSICPTLTAYMGKCYERVPIIKDEFGIRRLTPYECLALQGFPKTFGFPKLSMQNAYKQCGNSVVVPVIKRIAEKIFEVIQ